MSHAAPTGPCRSGGDPRVSQTLSPPDLDQSTSPIDVAVVDLDALLGHAAHTQHPTDIVITPVELHRRHLKRRLTAADQPLSAHAFVGADDVATRILDQTDTAPRSLDRVDRLDILEDALAEADKPRDLLAPLLGGDPMTDLKAVEQTRSEIEAITNYHPTRVQAYRVASSSLPGPIADDAHDALYGALAVEGALRKRSDTPPTTNELLRRATRKLVRSDQTLWEQAYPHAERVVLAGLSNVAAPLIDLLTAIAQASAVEVGIALRPATGPALRNRFPQTVVDDPGRMYIP